jgi:hypothetical protein
MMRLHVRTLLAACLVAGPQAAMAGTVEVSFVNQQSYTDAGTSSWDEDANLQVLARHLQSLAQRYLPADQVLRIEVLDVDLAGTARPSRQGGDLRVVRGKADFPRLHLKYTIEGGGKAQRTGDEWLSDLTYTGGLSSSYRDQPLYYEKRMIDAWFKARFLQGPGSAG